MNNLRVTNCHFLKVVQMFFGLMPLLIFQIDALAQRTITYSTPGTYSIFIYKSPSIAAEVWGGGGKGGNATENGTRSGGGGGGAYSRGFIAISGQIDYEVGQGSNTISAGVDSFVGSTTTVMAKGGASVFPNSNLGALGGLAADGFGIIKYNGGSGANGTLNNGGGGGSSAGINLAGTNATNQSGATAPEGGGNGANGATSNNNFGSNALGIGGGGGGATKSTGTTTVFLGGLGGNGQVKITWNCSNTLISGSPNQAVCVNSPILPVQYELAGSSSANISWSPSAPAGLTFNYLNGDYGISGTPEVVNNYSYTITPQYAAGSTGSCTGLGTITGTITVNPNQTAGSLNSNTFCIGTQLPANVTQPTTGGTGLGVPINLPPGITATFTSNNIVFTGTPTQSGSFPYIIPLTGGFCNVNATGTFIINATPAITDQNTLAQTRCINTPFNAISIGNGQGFTYQWFVNSGNSNSGGTAINGANSSSYKPPANFAGTFYYYVVISSTTCASSVTSPVSGAHIVNANKSAGEASASPAVCISTPITAITHALLNAAGIGTATGLPAGVTASLNTNSLIISGTPSVQGVFNYSIPLLGCGPSVAASGTITVNAVPAITSPSPSLAGQNRCINLPFSSVSVASSTGFFYQWFSNVNPTNAGGIPISGATSNSFVPPSSNEGSTYYYVQVSNSCGITAVSNISGEFKVNPHPVVSFETQPSGTFCTGQELTYTTQPGQNNYEWVLPGVAGTDYAIVSGGNPSSNSVTLKWLTVGNKNISVNYKDSNSCVLTSPTTSSTITVQKSTFSPPSISPSVCVSNLGDFISFTHATQLVTGIGGTTGLPDGLTATFDTGTITISGMIANTLTPGIYNYSIPLIGCGTTNATGFVEITPNYELISTSSVSPSNAGDTAFITLSGNPSVLIDGFYEVTYSLGLSNSGSETKTVSIEKGTGSFTTLPILSEDLTSLTISHIKKNTDVCLVELFKNNTTFFGIKAATFTENGSFYVPADIYEITIKVWGGGGGGGSSSNGAGGGGGGYSIKKVAVRPGEQIFINIGEGGSGQSGTPAASNGGPSYVTRNSDHPDPINSSLVYASGGRGASGSIEGDGGVGNSPIIGQNGELPTALTGGKGGDAGGSGGEGGLGGFGNGNTSGWPGEKPGGGGGGSKGNSNGGNGGAGLVNITYPLPLVGPCFRVIDDGSKSGVTIIEFICDTEWTAPTNLEGFEVYVGGAGGGGGAGSAAGGGGAGTLVQGQVFTNKAFGFDANTKFNIKVGVGGVGATGFNIPGNDGNSSMISGMLDGNSLTYSALGGGGGGSENNIVGRTGVNGSGGGGGGANNSAWGQGGNPNGGAGDFSPNQSRAGGGGGGLTSAGAQGKAAGLGQGEGGKGGNGRSFTMGDTVRYFGGGGGGVGFNFDRTPKIGFGGFVNNTKIGGDGNLTGTKATGFPGVEKTGSGGGAGYVTGGKGGDGVVYVYYEILRILPVEYIFIKAEYFQDQRSVIITWATAREWENSHFEVERSFQNITNWEAVGKVDGTGYSDEPVYYNFQDKNLPLTGGTVYYRLKQVDFSGNVDYSKVLSLRIPAIQFKQGVWRAYPNPTDGEQLKISLMDRNQYDDEPIIFRIIHPMSQTVDKAVRNEAEMNDILSQLAKGVPRGIFVVEIKWGQKIEHIKMIRK